MEVKRILPALLALLAGAPGARAAEAGRHALVVGNASYAALPALPACRGAAASVAAALRGQGYDVTERVDAGRGALDAALGGFARRAANAPSGPAVVYFCGYAAEFDGRLFLLPVSATLERDADALTQGVLARSAAGAAGRSSAGTGAVLFDLVARPGGQLAAASLQAVEASAAEASLAFVAAVASGSQAGTAPAAPLAAAIQAELPGSPALDSPAVVAAVRQRLVGQPGALVLAAAAPQRVTGTGQGVPASNAPSMPAPSGPVAAGEAGLLDEARLTDADRRRIQAALQARGFPSGRPDGRFTPALRAAVRRYQASLGAEATGRLTEEQTRRLREPAR